MLIFYCCYGRAHSSVVAAALHLGQLPLKTPTAICKLPYFDRAKAQDIGIPKLVGTDTHGNFVFILGRGPARGSVEATLETVLLACGYRKQDIMFIDLQPYLNFYARLGGFLSRRLGLVFPGKQLAAFGIWRALPQIEECVKTAKTHGSA
ncbi:MAG: DUF3189 family protein [Firmicutes bacterium]|jgi:hypothetical protein|nr:DUF3189 family protein [Bacillota bacterium]